MSDITVVLVDDHAVLRQALRLYLEMQGGVSVIGEASDGFEAVALVESLQPDLLILDIKMPGLDGIEVAQRITKGPSQTRVIMLSMYSNEAYVVQALRAGAAGYVTKESSGSELMTAMKDVMNGHHYLSPALSERAIELYKRTAAPSEFGLYETLTNREREVLELATEGKNNAKIGDLLGISIRTAESHRTNLMRKLALRSQAELILYSEQRRNFLGAG